MDCLLLTFRNALSFLWWTKDKAKWRDVDTAHFNISHIPSSIPSECSELLQRITFLVRLLIYSKVSFSSTSASKTSFLPNPNYPLLLSPPPPPSLLLPIESVSMTFVIPIIPFPLLHLYHLQMLLSRDVLNWIVIRFNALTENPSIHLCYRFHNHVLS